jgi:hypothetical protein
MSSCWQLKEKSVKWKILFEITKGFMQGFNDWLLVCNRLQISVDILHFTTYSPVYFLAYVLDKVALEQVFLRVTGFNPC